MPIRHQTEKGARVQTEKIEWNIHNLVNLGRVKIQDRAMVSTWKNPWNDLKGPNLLEPELKKIWPTIIFIIFSKMFNISIWMESPKSRMRHFDAHRKFRISNLIMGAKVIQSMLSSAIKKNVASFRLYFFSKTFFIFTKWWWHLFDKIHEYNCFWHIQQ